MWRGQNKERVREISRLYYQNNKTIINARKQKRKTQDTKYYLSELLRDRLKKALKGKYKTGSAVRDLGMPIDAFLVYLNLDALDKYGIPYTGNESRFHIDHVRPLASFNLEDAEQLKQAVHWSNLQILRAEENLAKGARTP